MQLSQSASLPRTAHECTTSALSIVLCRLGMRLRAMAAAAGEQLCAQYRLVTEDDYG